MTLIIISQKDKLKRDRPCGTVVQKGKITIRQFLETLPFQLMIV